MSDRPYFLIGEKEYPIPLAFRLCDPALVLEVTGMTWLAFTTAFKEMQELLLEAGGDPEKLEPEDVDPRVISGLVAVAIWQANPRWKRERVVSFVQQIDIEAVSEGSGVEEAGDDGPPAPAASVPPANSGSTADPS